MSNYVLALIGLELIIGGGGCVFILKSDAGGVDELELAAAWLLFWPIILIKWAIVGLITEIGRL